MRHAFRHLGLVPTTDQRAIKRAYAARLKQTRPEDDPAGFQVLQQCYEQALDWAKEEAQRLASTAAAPSQRDAHVSPVAGQAAEFADFDDAETVPPVTPQLPATSPAVLIDGPEAGGTGAPVAQVLIRDQPAPSWTPPIWTVRGEAERPLPSPPAVPVAELPPAMPVPPTLIAGESPPAPQRPPRVIDSAEAPAPAPPVSAPDAHPRPKSALRQRPPLQAPPDPGPLADAVIARAFHEGLSDWLEAHPHLLDLGQRDRLGGLIAMRMDELADLPAPQQMAELAEFFGWEPLSAPPLVRRVLARARVQAQLVEDAGIAFAYSEDQRLRRDQARLLVVPFVARMHYRHALFPSHVKQMTARLSWLDVDAERQLGRILDPQTLRFWGRLGDPGMNGTRVWLMVLRAMMLAIPPSLVALLRGAGGSAPLVWLGFTASFLSLQWLFVGGRWLRQSTLRRVHYWRSARADLLLASAAAAVLALGLLWPDGTINTLARFGGWFFVVLGLGSHRALPLIVAGMLWLFAFPVAWSPQTPLLAPYATLFTALLLDRLIAHVTRRETSDLQQRAWLACWNLLPPLALAIGKTLF